MYETGTRFTTHSLNPFFSQFLYYDLGRLTALLSLIFCYQMDLGTILISQCIHHQQLRL